MFLSYEEMNNRLKYEEIGKNRKLDHYYKHEFRKRIKRR